MGDPGRGKKVSTGFPVAVNGDARASGRGGPAAVARLHSQLTGCPNAISQAAFVAGSGYDLFGTSKVGLATYWHNRVGLALPEGAPAPAAQSARLEDALPWLARFGGAGRDGTNCCA